MKKGIDVSCWNTDIDFNELKKTGVEFVIIRAGYGQEKYQKDSMFEKHYANAKKSGLKIGAYWYSYATTFDNAKKEALVCLECVSGKQFDLPIYYDVEDKVHSQLTANKLQDLIDTFATCISNSGYRCGVYSYVTLLEKIGVDFLNKYHVWVAQYNTICQYSGKYDIWQYTNKYLGKNLDGNICYNANIFEEKTKPITPAELYLAFEVLAGKYGNGNERKNNLKDKYEKTQKIVNILYEGKDIFKAANKLINEGV